MCIIREAYGFLKAYTEMIDFIVRILLGGCIAWQKDVKSSFIHCGRSMISDALIQEGVG